MECEHFARCLKTNTIGVKQKTFYKNKVQIYHRQLLYSESVNVWEEIFEESFLRFEISIAFQIKRKFGRLELCSTAGMALALNSANLDLILGNL